MNNIQHDMHAFKSYQSFISCSNEPKSFKTIWNHGFNMVMNMHVSFDHEINFKLTKTHMHATMEFQFNTFVLNHGSTLKFGMKHARTSLNSTIRGSMAYLKSLIKRIQAQICNLCFKSFNFQAMPSKMRRITLFLLLSLSKVGKNKGVWLMNCLINMQ